MMYRPHTTSASPTNDPFNQAPNNIGYVSRSRRTSLTLRLRTSCTPKYIFWRRQASRSAPGHVSLYRALQASTASRFPRKSARRLQ